MAVSEAKRRANDKYNSKMRSVAFRVNPETESDILEKLANVPSKADYIKKLILKDIAENSK